MSPIGHLQKVLGLRPMRRVEICYLLLGPLVRWGRPAAGPDEALDVVVVEVCGGAPTRAPIRPMVRSINHIASLCRARTCSSAAQQTGLAQASLHPSGDDHLPP